MSEHLLDGVPHDDGRSGDPLFARHVHGAEPTSPFCGEHHKSAADPWEEVFDGIRRMIRDEISAQSAAHATPDLVGSGVDLLGKLLDRLPDALSVADLCLILDRFDVALRGHESSPSIGAASVLPPAVSDPIVGDASGTGGVPPVPVSDASTEEDSES